MHERVSALSQACNLLRQLTPRRNDLAVVVGVALAALSGCGRGPARIKAPDWDPSGLADNILSALDKNADGAIDAEELLASPGLTAGAKLIDDDNDGKLTREELEARFEKYQKSRAGVVPTTYLVTYRGRPVADATVDFIPETWQDETIEPARGTSDGSGYVSPLIDNPALPGIRVGFYRVKVTSPQVKIPEKYASDQSPLGVNVSTGDPNSGYADKRLTLTD